MVQSAIPPIIQINASPVSEFYYHCCMSYAEILMDTVIYYPKYRTNV